MLVASFSRLNVCVTDKSVRQEKNSQNLNRKKKCCRKFVIRKVKRRIITEEKFEMKFSANRMGDEKEGKKVNCVCKYFLKNFSLFLRALNAIRQSFQQSDSELEVSFKSFRDRKKKKILKLL